MIKKLLIVLMFCFVTTPSIAENHTVVNVIDCNTLQLENTETVRLIGVDCPNMNTKEGQEATEFVKALVEGKDADLQFYVQKTDKDGRLWAYVLVVGLIYDKNLEVTKTLKAKNKLFGIPTPKNPILCDENGCWLVYSGLEMIGSLNAAIIKAGYASPTAIPPNVKFDDLFQKLSKEELENRRELRK